jgi:membrane protein YqaA with SNARE-associated domain
MNKLFRDLFYASALGALLGWAIGTLLRRHRERQATVSSVVTTSRRDHAELHARWQDKRPNSIS